MANRKNSSETIIRYALTVHDLGLTVKAIQWDFQLYGLLVTEHQIKSLIKTKKNSPARLYYRKTYLIYRFIFSWNWS